MVERSRSLAPAASALVLALAVAAAAPPPALAQYPLLDPERGVMTMAPLLERTTPAVVNVSVASRVPAAQNPLFADPFFRRFFDLPEQLPEREAISAGSGVIVDARRGHVLTNHHVVANAERITVTLKDARAFEAELLGSDPATDIALLRIPSGGLGQLAFGDSTRLEVGDLVVAVGNPFGLGQTVTSGIVSALGRGGVTNDKLEDFIQTDAPINPGNSGGPLVNLRGEVVGVNSAIASPTGFYAGYGFAVPIDLARKVADDLVRFGKVRRPALGITLKDVSPEDAEVFRLPRIAGVVVNDLTPGQSAAREAGIRQGDVIVAVDGAQVERTGQLQRLVATHRPGETITLDVIRGGERRQVKVKLAEAPVEPEQRAQREPAAAPAEPVSSDVARRRLGLRVVPLTAALASQYNLRNAQGVVVEESDRFGPAGRQGINRGARIVSVDGVAVTDVATFTRLVERKRGGQIVSLVVEGPSGQQGIENVRLAQ